MNRFAVTIVVVTALAVIVATAIQSQDEEVKKPKPEPVGWEYETVTSIEVRLALQAKMKKEGFDFGDDSGDEVIDLLFPNVPEKTEIEFRKRVHSFHAEYLNQRDDDGWEFCGGVGDRWVFRRKK